MTVNNRITFNPDSGAVDATLTDVTFGNMVKLFEIETLMLSGRGPILPDGRRRYLFTMPNDERRDHLMEFIKWANNHTEN